MTKTDGITRSKISKKQFKLFKKECRRWIKKLGIKEWDVGFGLEKCSDGCRASVNYDIRYSALHEVLHLSLADITFQGKSRAFDVGEFDSAEHQVIGRLVTLLGGDKVNEKRGRIA